VPVILITAFGDDETHAEALRLGADAILDKPFEPRELLAAVRRLVARRGD
jgi:DNA-binding response OmpR family regulator